MRGSGRHKGTSITGHPARLVIVEALVIVEGLGTIERVVIVEGLGTIEPVGTVEVIARVQEPATGPRIAVELVAIGLEIEVYRQAQTAVLREALSAAPAAVPAVHARAVRGAHRA